VRIGPGAIAFDTDTAGGVIKGCHPGQASYTEFAGDVSAQPGDALFTGRGGHVHDRSAGPAGQHQFDLVLQAKEHAAQTDGDGAVELRTAPFGKGCRRPPTTGRIVDRGIEPPEPVANLGQHPFDRLLTGHIHGQDHGAAASPMNGLRLPGQRVAVPGRQDHLRSGIGKGRSNRGADAPARPGDQRHLAG
jgi:hypothetical protein